MLVSNLWSFSNHGFGYGYWLRRWGGGRETKENSILNSSLRKLACNLFIWHATALLLLCSNHQKPLLRPPWQCLLYSLEKRIFVWEKTLRSLWHYFQWVGKNWREYSKAVGELDLRQKQYTEWSTSSVSIIETRVFGPSWALIFQPDCITDCWSWMVAKKTNL